MSELLNNELRKVVEWLHLNKLSLNVKKTHYMIFTMKKKFNLTEKIYINNTVVERVNVTKFLGVNIDSKLSWMFHIQFIKIKIAKGIGILCKAQKYLGVTSLVTLYHSFIYPYISYCTEIWGGACTIHLSSIVLSAAERRGTPVLLSATVSDNSGNSPQVAAPRRLREINQSTQRCSLLDQIHTLSCTKQKYGAIN